MNTRPQQLRNEGVRDAFLDIASIVAIVLIGVVVIALSQPRSGWDLGSVLRVETQSTQAANASAGR
jgi:hypothetical protein